MATAYTFPPRSRVEVKATNERTRRIKYLNITDIVRLCPSQYIHELVTCQFNASKTFGHIQLTSPEVASELVAATQFLRIALSDGIVYRINARIHLFRLPLEVSVVQVVSLVGLYLREAVQSPFSPILFSVILIPQKIGQAVAVTELYRRGSNVWTFLPQYISVALTCKFTAASTGSTSSSTAASRSPSKTSDPSPTDNRIISSPN